MSKLQHVSMGLCLVVAALGAQAQAGNGPTTSHTPSSATATPDNVGVTPQTAAEANKKAVPRADTGTLVRTGPSAADRVKETRDETNTTAAPANPDYPAPVKPARRPRADRN